MSKQRFQSTGPTSLLTQREINDCLGRAFASLSPVDQANIERVMTPLLDIPGMGPVSALRLLFAVDRVDDLARLNETMVAQADDRARLNKALVKGE